MDADTYAILIGCGLGSLIGANIGSYRAVRDLIKEESSKGTNEYKIKEILDNVETEVKKTLFVLSYPGHRIARKIYHI